MKKKLSGSLCLLAATVIWGSAFIAQRVGMDHIGPFTFQAIRCALAAVFLLPLTFLAEARSGGIRACAARWLDPSLWKSGMICGLALFVATTLQQIGLIDTDAGKAGFLTAMYIVLVPVLGIFLGRKPSVSIAFSIALAVLGLYLLSWAGGGSLQGGDAALIGCSLAFAVQILCIDRFAPQVDALRLNCVQSLVVAVLSLVGMAVSETPTMSGIAGCAGALIFAGVFSMGIAYSLQINGQKHLEPAAASLIMSLESVFAALGGWLLLDETMSTEEIWGCVLVFLAVILSQLPSRKPKSTHPEADHAEI